jgi:hypothetical protein
MELVDLSARRGLAEGIPTECAPWRSLLGVSGAVCTAINAHTDEEVSLMLCIPRK